MNSIKSRHPFNLYYNGGDYVKICGSQDGFFPDFGHHIPNEMGGIWLHPVKLLDGFWLRVTDPDRNISVWARADEFESHPWGNVFHYDHGLGHIPVSIERTQFATEGEKGMAVAYRIHHYGKGAVRLKLELLFRTDLRPVWFSDEVGVVDGLQDEAAVLSPRKVLVKDSDHDWYVQVGTDLPGDEVSEGAGLYGPELTAGNGCGVRFAGEVAIGEGETAAFRLFVAGSYVSAEECGASYDVIQSSYEKLLEEKKQVYDAIALRSALTVESDPALTEQFRWAKWNNRWLVQTVEGIGRGLTAGGPTYPWWFGCDNTYSLQGVLSIGDADLAKETLDLLLRKSEEVNGNGRFIHEATTLGAVSNPGNTQETAHYIAFLWDYFRWTGDEETLRRHYAYALKGIEWLLGEMDQDGDLFPSGYGIIEIAGLNMELIDSAVYTAKALESLAAISRFFGEEERGERFGMLAERARKAVNEAFWVEEAGLYADAVAPKSDIVPKLDYMVSLAERQGKTGYRDYVNGLLEAAGDDYGDRGWLLNKNWVIVTPMEAGIADADKGRLALQRMRNDTFIGQYGTYLSGMFQQGTMTISTGVHAVAEAAYGNPDAALDLLHRMGASFSRALPGSFSEMSPDFGCVVQAWTIYALAVPIVRHFFGVTPDAHGRRLTVAPRLPKAWEAGGCSLERLVVGGALFDIRLETGDGVRTAAVTNVAGWLIELDWCGKRVSSREKLVRLEVPVSAAAADKASV